MAEPTTVPGVLSTVARRDSREIMTLCDWHLTSAHINDQEALRRLYYFMIDALRVAEDLVIAGHMGAQDILDGLSDWLCFVVHAKDENKPQDALLDRIHLALHRVFRLHSDAILISYRVNPPPPTQVHSRREPDASSHSNQSHSSSNSVPKDDDESPHFPELPIHAQVAPPVDRHYRGTLQDEHHEEAQSAWMASATTEVQDAPVINATEEVQDAPVINATDDFHDAPVVPVAAPGRPHAAKSTPSLANKRAAITGRLTHVTVPGVGAAMMRTPRFVPAPIIGVPDERISDATSQSTTVTALGMPHAAKSTLSLANKSDNTTPSVALPKLDKVELPTDSLRMIMNAAEYGVEGIVDALISSNTDDTLRGISIYDWSHEAGSSFRVPSFRRTTWDTKTGVLAPDTSVGSQSDFAPPGATVYINGTSYVNKEKFMPPMTVLNCLHKIVATFKNKTIKHLLIYNMPFLTLLMLRGLLGSLKITGSVVVRGCEAVLPSDFTNFGLNLEGTAGSPTILLQGFLGNAFLERCKDFSHISARLGDFVRLIPHMLVTGGSHLYLDDIADFLAMFPVTNGRTFAKKLNVPPKRKQKAIEITKEFFENVRSALARGDKSYVPQQLQWFKALHKAGLGSNVNGQSMSLTADPNATIARATKCHHTNHFGQFVQGGELGETYPLLVGLLFPRKYSSERPDCQACTSSDPIRDSVGLGESDNVTHAGSHLDKMPEFWSEFQNTYGKNNGRFDEQCLIDGFAFDKPIRGRTRRMLGDYSYKTVEVKPK